MRKLALVISGAVSLGAWEAGVLDELFYLLDHLSERRSAAKRSRGSWT